MKQLKIYAMALMALMGMTFTSCLDNETDPTMTVMGLVKVNNYMGKTYFTDCSGATVYPNATSLAQMDQAGFKVSNMNVGYMVGTYNSELYPNAYEEKKYQDVSLQYFWQLDATVEKVAAKGAGNDSINRAPILGLEAGNVCLPSSLGHYGFIDRNTLILQINYYLSQSKIGKHKFALVYYENEPHGEEDGNDVLTLHLRHYNADDTAIGLATGNNTYLIDSYIFAFNLRAVLADFADKNGGNMPTTVKVETVENPSSLSFENSSVKTYTIPYKPLGQN